MLLLVRKARKQNRVGYKNRVKSFRKSTAYNTAYNIISKFSGDMKDQIYFRDLFNDMVVKSNYSDYSKQPYLKDSLKNEPYYLIKNLNVTEGSFK